MRIPLSWLAEYVPLAIDPRQLAHRLTMAGIETSYDPGPRGSWDKVVVGCVQDVSPHPNADRLRLATVDTGNSTQTVVCGAPNVAPGQRIAFAHVGASLVNGKTGAPMELTAAVIRGVESAGMVCSERELGLSDEHEGILVLPEGSPVGAPLAEALPRGDAFEIDVTPNRGDCLSVLGLAHEIAAITASQVAEPPLGYEESGEDIADSIDVEIADPELCPRYICALVRGVRIGPSPRWAQRRLEEVGHRSINNVVDVTNYVMLEYGQPLHAFDLDQVRGDRIIVRPAKRGERFTSLDGQEHALNPPMLTIADAERPIGLAGVIGGRNSEMTTATVNVLLESATFNAINTRRTAAALKLRTEASLRFEKGINPDLAERAVRRATRLILETAGGVAAQGIRDAFPGKSAPPRIPFSSASLVRVLGADYPPAQARQALSSLGFTIEGGADATFVAPPYWRTDIALEEDVVEEVARTVGYDAVPTEPLAGRAPDAIHQPARELREEARDLLTALGLQETISYTLVSEAAAGEGALRVANPMSRDQERLRTSLRPAALRNASTALRQSPESAMIFEVGRVFLPREGDLPEEREMAVGVVAGVRGETLWEKGAPALDFYDAKGVVEALLDHLGLTPTFERINDDATLHPDRAARVVLAGNPVGIVGELSPATLQSYALAVGTAALFELDLEAIVPLTPPLRSRFEPFSRYPVASRDLALVVDAGAPAADLLDIIKDDPLVVRATLFDQFEGSGLPRGKKSLAFRFDLQSRKETLTATQIADAVSAIVARLERECGAALRT